MDCILKIVLVGEGGVGKSWLIGSYYNRDLSQIRSTLGVHFQTQDFDINGKEIRVQFWDTAGQERFSSLNSVYYRGAHAVVIAYDVTNYSSFVKIKERWMEEVVFNIAFLYSPNFAGEEICW